MKKLKASIFLEVAETVEQKIIGLTGRVQLPENHGMVFIFKPSQVVSMWMKGSIISFDIIFVNEGEIVNVAENAEPDQNHTMYYSGVPITEAIEIKAGVVKKFDIKIKDSVSFENIAQISNLKRFQIMKVYG